MRHTKYICNCNRNYCQFCDGGLFSCTVCGGVEGSLTTDCCGEKLSEIILDTVYMGRVDFVNGTWIDAKT